MIICICNSLNEKKVKAAIDQGARTPGSVYAAHGTKMCCGQCRPDINTMIAKTTGAAAATH